MRTINTIAGQSLFDIAVQEYGNADAISAILEDNPDLGASAELDLAQVLTPVAALSIRTDSDLINQTALRILDGATIATL